MPREPIAISRPPRLGLEILVVLGLSFGQSGVYALLHLARMLGESGSLRNQTATLNRSVSDLSWLDVVYQLTGAAFAMAPVALALYLLAIRPALIRSDQTPNPFRRLGLDFTQLPRDLGWGTALAACIGLPGIGFYLLGRQLGWTAQVTTNNLGAHWWTVPVLVIAALAAGASEEVVVVGYLMGRFESMAWPTWAAIAASATLRGSYHLYQGF